jgi:branched-chain amino acid transport system substrate-binding protein
MAPTAEGWPFLVARGRRASYRTVLAPGFLVDENAHHALADATGVSELRPDGTRLVEWHHARVGPFSIGYTSEHLTQADIDPAAADAAEPATDEHGRPLEIVYGIVSQDLLTRPLSAEDLIKARATALSSYRDFLADEGAHGVATSSAFALQTPAQARPAREVDGVAARGEAGGLSAATPWYRRGRLVTAGAITIAAALAIAVALGVWSGSRELTIYASLPLHGSERQRSMDVAAGMRLALKQAGGKAGSFAIKFTVLDDSTAEARGWAPKAVTGNALKAAEDDSTAVYLGDLESAASAQSIPILSRARVAQISPSSTAVGLTSRGPGAVRGEPEKYYTGGFRNYVRIVPSDAVQARALASVMRGDGCTRTAILHDGGLYGSGLARSLRILMQAGDQKVVIDELAALGSAARERELARRVAGSGADCVVFSGNTRTGSVEIFEALAAALPRARLYGSDGVANRPFTDVELGGLPTTVAARVKLTLPAVGRTALDAEGKRFLAQFVRAYPDNRNPDPYAIYGYEAMALALDAIARSRTGTRQDIVHAVFATKHRRSVIGTYSIDRNGDTTLTRYGLFAIRDGAPIFERTIQASPARPR